MRSLAFLLALAGGAYAADVGVAWDPVVDYRITGYEVGWGPEPSVYAQFQIEAGTTATLTLPEPGPVHISVRTLGMEGGQPIQSEWSNELVWRADPTYTQPLAQLGLWARYLRQGGLVMAAPTFVAEYPTAFDTTSSPKTAMSSVAINSGDVLIAVAAHETENGTALSITENGAASATVLQGAQGGNYAETRAWGYVAPTNETITISFAKTSDSFGGNVIRFSGSDGIGASAIAESSGSPSVSLTTTQANSAIVVIVGDWNAKTGTQTFTSNGGAGSPTNLTGYPGDNQNYGVGIAYYANAGAAGSKTLGMSAPTGQAYTIIAAEVKGTSGGAATSFIPPNPIHHFAHLLGR